MTALNIPPKPTASDLIDNVNKPKHYQCPFPMLVDIPVNDPTNNTYGTAKIKIFVQALDVIKAWGLQKDAYLFNVVKYILRSGKKGDDKQYLEDLAKSRFYLNEKIKELAEELGVPVPQSHNH